MSFGFLEGRSEFEFYLFGLGSLHFVNCMTGIISTSELQGGLPEIRKPPAPCLASIVHSRRVSSFIHSSVAACLWFWCLVLDCSTEALPRDCWCLMCFLLYQKRKWGKNQWLPDISVQWPILISFTVLSYLMFEKIPGNCQFHSHYYVDSIFYPKSVISSIPK